MNKSIIWIVAIVIILGLGWFLLGSSEEVTENTGTGENLEEAGDQAFENVETTDEILNEIDDSLNYLE